MSSRWKMLPGSQIETLNCGFGRRRYWNELPLEQRSQPIFQGKYTFKLIVRDLVTGCQSSDTVDVNVIAEPNVIIKTIPDYCVNSGINVNMFDYITVNGVKPTGGTIYIQDVNGITSHDTRCVIIREPTFR